jgi:hypothetical protein
MAKVYEALGVDTYETDPDILLVFANEAKGHDLKLIIN